ncbi:MAG: hypothetical protein M1816_002901 [Peltula sp. TS41687]|nr:MAG: hypothetical protein M1816_002901 [Peltula sp. TS41687]
MPFLSGFISGVTLTSTILYLSLSTHRHNRARQSLALKRQKATLMSLLEHDPDLSSSQTQHGEALAGGPEMMVMRVQRRSLVETVKDRWNADVEGVVRSMVEGWDAGRERVGGGLVGLLRRE